MTLRTKGYLDVLNHMPTIKEVGADFRNVVMEVHGMYDKKMGTLERIGGKLLEGVSSTPIWSLTQLRFRDSWSIAVNQGGVILITTGLPPLADPDPYKWPPFPPTSGSGGITPDSTSSGLPPDPEKEADSYGSPMDDPQGSGKRTLPPPGGGPTPVERERRWPMVLSTVPSSLTIDMTIGETAKDYKLLLSDEQTGGMPVSITGDGFWYIEVLTSHTWLSSSMGASGTTFSTNWTDGSLGEKAKLGVAQIANADDVPYGTTWAWIRMRAMTWYSGYPLTATGSLSGSQLGVTMPVTVKNIERYTGNTRVTGTNGQNDLHPYNAGTSIPGSKYNKGEGFNIGTFNGIALEEVKYWNKQSGSFVNIANWAGPGWYANIFDPGGWSTQKLVDMSFTPAGVMSGSVSASRPPYWSDYSWTWGPP